MARARIAAGVAAGVSAAVLGALLSVDGFAPVASAAPRVADLIAPPAGGPTGTLRLGRLDFLPCALETPTAVRTRPLAATCAHLSVPENWGDPTARQIQLRLAVVPSLAPDPAPDLVVFLDGGPGGAATLDYPVIEAALAPLRRRHHILLVDQRGTGGSNALRCESELGLETHPPADPPSADAAGGHAPGETQTRVQRCLTRLRAHAAPQFYTTSAAVRDLEAVRQALGGVALDLLGISYGSRVAQQYAIRYPHAVRSLVLDSAVPNDVALLGDSARNLEDVLRLRAARCRAQRECVHRYGDPLVHLRALLMRLRLRPERVPVHDMETFAVQTRTLGVEELTALVRYYLYGATTSAQLPYVLREADEGHYAPLFEHAQSVNDALARARSDGMAASVLCSEDIDQAGAAPVLAAKAASASAAKEAAVSATKEAPLSATKEAPVSATKEAPVWAAKAAPVLFGAGAERAAWLACRSWPKGSVPPGFHDPFVSDAPVLLLAGEFDPVTPARYAREIAAHLPHARVLIAPGEGHAVIGTGCLPHLVAEFVDAGRDPRNIDASCLERAPPHPDPLPVGERE